MQAKKEFQAVYTKATKGTPVSARPFEMNDRSVFGHWEGDLVTGSSDGQNGAYFTLIERVTRLYIMIPINRKLSKQVYMKINKLYKFYGENFSTIFKSITFDYGNEF
ncbi:transposase, partial [Anaerorhabdus sp.]|uniref:transposase n=1 Tax=Anaerorhabdus sp. TaxID=1872524 RepID=UPI003AA777B0